MPDSLDDGGMAARKGTGKGSAGRAAGPAPGLGHGEFVMYPGTRGAVYDLLERLSHAAGDSPDYGTPGLSLDRTRLTVRWHGELPPAVQAVVDGAAGVTVVVQATPFRPGDLRAEADRLRREHGDVVAAATARPEGDGIEVLVPPAVAGAAGGAERAVADLVGEFPLFAEVGDPLSP
jgi:hypothetical protein